MKKTLMSSFAVAAVSALLLSGCGKKDESKPAEPAKPAVEAPAVPAAPVAAAADPAGEAKKAFDTRCVVCHGATGAGDGPGAANLDPKPRNYTDAEWQKTVTDEQLATAIVKGGAAIGKSPLMPPNPDLEAKPEVVAEMVKMIRAFGAAQ